MSDPAEPAPQDERNRYDNIFGGAGARGAAPLVGIGKDDERPSAAKRAGRGFLRWARTAAITLATLYIIGHVASVALIVGVNRNFARLYLFAGAAERRAVTIPALEYRLPRDPTIGAMQAGLALASLSPVPTRAAPAGLTYRVIEGRPAAPWRGFPLPTDLFPGNHGQSSGLPNADAVLRAVSRGGTAEQRRALRMIGAAPIWQSYDLVARATTVDLIGSRFELPFSADVDFSSIPTIQNSGTNEMAYAGVARAAWHLAEGRRDSAEFALRAIISVGAAITESTNLVNEQLIGFRSINIGRAALVEFYTIVGDPRGKLLAAAVEAAPKNYRRPPALAEIGPADATARRQRLLDAIGSADVPRAIRIELLSQLSATSCGSVREVVFGQDDFLAATVAQLKAQFARTPGDLAVIEMLGRSIDKAGFEALLRNNGAGAEAVLLVSKLYFNPRLANCAVMAVSGGRFR